MKVLVVDDDRTTRFLLRRVLVAELGCIVNEASDGVEALDLLAATRYQLVILDVQMPLMDGLETLRALRDAPDFKLLPVVMLTAERNEAIVQQIIGLGVLDYMTKPLVPGRIAERLKRVTRWLQTENMLVPDRVGNGLDDQASLLIVDGSEDFRRFVADTVGAKRAVRQAETGARGFRECLEARPGAVFIGSGLGVLNESLLVRKIRSTSAIHDTYLVAVLDKEEDPAARSAGYDGHVTRTFIAENFLRQLESLSTAEDGPLRDLLTVHPGLRVTLISAAEQVFGMMLSTEVVLRDASPLVPGERVMAAAAAQWQDRFSVELRGCCDVQTGRQMAASLLGIEPSMVGDEDVDEAVCEVFAMIGARLQNTLADKQVTLSFGVPAVARLTGPVGSAADGEILLCFESPGREVQFWLRLSVDPSVPAVDAAAGDAVAGETVATEAAARETPTGEAPCEPAGQKETLAPA